MMGAPLWGSYITDLFKSFRLTDSKKLNELLKDEHWPENAEKDKGSLREEVRILSRESKDIVLIALGRKTEKYLRRLF